ncbi:MAG: hypothetical protein RML46_09245 [Anaerolineae bacterium]|nr:hypothetical protein [Anaerolineae bacterium]
MKREDQIFLTVGAVGLVIILAIVGGVVYALLKASVVTLRWWAGLATLAAIILPALAWYLGTREARARLAGIDQGIDRVAKAAAQTVNVAQQTAAVRVGVAQAMRRPAIQPAVQVFLPGLPSGGGPVILPASGGQEEVEL